MERLVSFPVVSSDLLPTPLLPLRHTLSHVRFLTTRYFPRLRTRYFRQGAVDLFRLPEEEQETLIKKLSGIVVALPGPCRCATTNTKMSTSNLHVHANANANASANADDRGVGERYSYGSSRR